jgi:GTP-binding protein HflX
VCPSSGAISNHIGLSKNGNVMRFSSKAISEHVEVPLADEGRLEKLVAHWAERRNAPPEGDATRSYVVSVGCERDPLVRAAQMEEIVALVQSQGGCVAGREICHLAVPNPRTLLGKGTAGELAARARSCGAMMLVLDAELSPSQARNLEDVAGIPVCDREAIILNVFLRHARTRRARIQVEIAQLEYLRPRIRGVGLDMDQQAGGMARARGPGETASELLARKLDGRLEELRKALRRLNTSARTQRRQRDMCKRIVLVGYTNAGKTSLMNALTSSELSARDMPFETLDTTSRCLTRHGGEVLLCDTVGFIRRLPERLLASFESTLAEIALASLLVIVLDAADHERELKLRTTLELVEKIGAKDVPRFYVYNKLDCLPARPDVRELAEWSGEHPWAILSTRDPRAVADLEVALLSAVRREEDEFTTFVPYVASELLSLVYGRCRVLDTVAADDGMTLTIRGPLSVIATIRRSEAVRS